MEVTGTDLFRAIFLVILSSFLASLTGSSLSTITLALSHCLWLKRKKENSLAVGLAWSYYFGYLKIVLPNLVENINKSSSQVKDKLLRQLFVLVPANCEVFDKVNDADRNIEFKENLCSIEQNTAGIHVRKYVNTLYQVDVNGEQFYAAIEYATPLRTLAYMSKYKETGLSRPEAQRQAYEFWQTTQDILENHADQPEMKKRIQFIYLEEGMSVSNEILKAAKAALSKCK
eukprot:gene7946-8803_t